MSDAELLAAEREAVDNPDDKGVRERLEKLRRAAGVCIWCGKERRAGDFCAACSDVIERHFEAIEAQIGERRARRRAGGPGQHPGVVDDAMRALERAAEAGDEDASARLVRERLRVEEGSLLVWHRNHAENRPVAVSGGVAVELVAVDNWKPLRDEGVARPLLGDGPLPWFRMAGCVPMIVVDLAGTHPIVRIAGPDPPKAPSARWCRLCESAYKVDVSLGPGIRKAPDGSVEEDEETRAIKFALIHPTPSEAGRLCQNGCGLEAAIRVVDPRSNEERRLCEPHWNETREALRRWSDVVLSQNAQRPTWRCPSCGVTLRLRASGTTLPEHNGAAGRRCPGGGARRPA